MVLRSALLVAALVIQTAHGQSRISSGPAKIILTLPANIPSENVQISYFMTGAFGGYGSFVRAEKGRNSYDIDVPLMASRPPILSSSCTFPAAKS